METKTDQQQKELIRERFTRTAQVFGEFAVSHRVKEAELLARLVQATPNDRVLDLACGPGTLALRFATQVGWTCGLDLTPAMLEHACRSAASKKLSRLDFAIGDAHVLPFADGSFDIALISYSLHHMPEPERVIGEMARVIGRGGRMGILDIRAPEDPDIARCSNLIERVRDSSHTRTLARSEFENILTARGLRVAAIETIEDERDFDHWMHVAGWEPGDREYHETRRLMEATIPDDSAGFHAQFAPSDSSREGEKPGIRMVNTTLVISAEKL